VRGERTSVGIKALRRLLEHMGTGRGEGISGCPSSVSLAAESIWDVVVACLGWSRATINREV